MCVGVGRKGRMRVVIMVVELVIRIVVSSVLLLCLMMVF